MAAVQMQDSSKPVHRLDVKGRQQHRVSQPSIDPPRSHSERLPISQAYLGGQHPLSHTECKASQHCASMEWYLSRRSGGRSRAGARRC